MVQNLGLSVTIVDPLLVMAAKLIFWDLSKHGIMRPKMGPLLLKSQTGKSAVIDVGTAKLITRGVIDVIVHLLLRYKSKLLGDSEVFSLN